jgi:hypothetical protein
MLSATCITEAFLLFDLLFSYGAAMVGVATAKSPCGPYTYKASWKPLGAESRDMGLFQDGKGQSHSIIAAPS